MFRPLLLSLSKRVTRFYWLSHTGWKSQNRGESWRQKSILSRMNYTLNRLIFKWNHLYHSLAKTGLYCL